MTRPHIHHHKTAKSRFASNLLVAGMMLAAVMAAFTSCSTTKNLRENDQLFIGLTKIEYKNYDKESEADHFNMTKEEVEASLATAPNGALFGSSYYRTPFPYGLWIWNAFSGSKNKIAQWITKTFGKAPVLMRQVNPELRTSVAQSVLRNHGYLNGTVSYKIVPQKNPKKAKIGYTVDFGPLFTVDSLEYKGFPDEADSLIRNKTYAISSPISAYVDETGNPTFTQQPTQKQSLRSMVSLTESVLGMRTGTSGTPAWALSKITGSNTWALYGEAV